LFRRLAALSGLLILPCFLTAPRPAEAAVVWQPNGTVFALALDPIAGILYVGGNFTDSSPAPHDFLAAIDLKTGQPTDWNPRPDAPVRALVLSADGQTLYVGGDFTQIGGDNRGHIAAIRTDTGQARNDDWTAGADGPVYAMVASDAGIVVGGAFSTIADPPVTRHGLAELFANGTRATELGLNDDLPASSVVRALARAGNRLYVGGDFTAVGGQPRFNLAAFDLDTHDVLDWAPQFNDGTISALHVIPGKPAVFAGGSFSSVAGVKHVGIVALDPADGHPLDWDPALTLNGNEQGVTVDTLASSLDRSVLYVGGDFAFTSVGGVTHDRAVAIHASNAVVRDDWRVNADGAVRVLLPAESLDGNKDPSIYDYVYAGGDFTQINDAPQAHLSAVSALPPEADPPVTTATPAGGVLNSETNRPIVLTCDDGDGSGCAATYYTIDGSAPTLGSDGKPAGSTTLYEQPINLTTSRVLKFFSVDKVGNREAVQTAQYTIEVEPPTTTASPGSEVFFTRALSITLRCADAVSGCAATYYTTDGTRPTTASARYTGPIVIGGTTVLQFFSVDGAGNEEGVQRQEYVQNRGRIGAVSPIEAVAGVILLLGAGFVRKRRPHA
jgi:hypothetical protein